MAIEQVAEALQVSPNIHGLWIGGLEKRVALYADDILLYLNDAGLSLQGALDLMNAYSAVTGLRVNWSKSFLFPIDLGAQATAFPDTPLQWVTEFKYLGVVISRKVSDFLI